MTVVMRIKNKFPTQPDIEVPSPTVVPRVGERVDMGYTPGATVTQVAYMYDNFFVASDGTKVARSLLILVLTD